VVATLRRGTGDRTIALRADMDCLQIEETTNLPYASSKPGLMHACGHDGHTTILLGAAATLARDGGFDGTVRFVFQPAEEWGQGMKAMIRDGLGSRLPFDEIYGLHNKPGLPVGSFETRTGAYMGAEDGFRIAHDCTVEIDYDRVFVPLVNAAEPAAHALDAATAVFGADKVDSNAPRMGASEDFARALHLAPGAFVFIGNGDSAALHNAEFDFNDDALEPGVQWFTELVRRRLPESV